MTSKLFIETTSHSELTQTWEGVKHLFSVGLVRMPDDSAKGLHIGPVSVGAQLTDDAPEGAKPSLRAALEPYMPAMGAAGVALGFVVGFALGF